MKNIILTKTTNGGTPEITLISKREYHNITNTETLKWFRRLGGSETAQRSYTSAGYLITRLISRSPDRQTKIERDFIFISFSTYKQER